MSDVPSTPANEAASVEKFEVLLERLEQIVAEMESGEMPLDHLLHRYEEGIRLVQACGERLAEAEQKVEILSRTTSGIEAKETRDNGGGFSLKTDDLA